MGSQKKTVTAEDVFLTALASLEGTSATSFLSTAAAYVTFAEASETSLQEAASVARLNGYAAANLTHVRKVTAIRDVMGDTLTNQHALDVVVAMRLGMNGKKSERAGIDDWQPVALAIETGDAEAVRDAVVTAAESARERSREAEASKRREAADKVAEREAEKERVAGLSEEERLIERVAADTERIEEIRGNGDAEQSRRVEDALVALEKVRTFAPTLTFDQITALHAAMNATVDALESVTLVESVA